MRASGDKLVESVKSGGRIVELVTYFEGTPDTHLEPVRYVLTFQCAEDAREFTRVVRFARKHDAPMTQARRATADWLQQIRTHVNDEQMQELLDLIYKERGEAIEQEKELMREFEATLQSVLVTNCLDADRSSTYVACGLCKRTIEYCNTHHDECKGAKLRRMIAMGAWQGMKAE